MKVIAWIPWILTITCLLLGLALVASPWYFFDQQGGLLGWAVGGPRSDDPQANAFDLLFYSFVSTIVGLLFLAASFIVSVISGLTMTLLWSIGRGRGTAGNQSLSGVFKDSKDSRSSAETSVPEKV